MKTHHNDLFLQVDYLKQEVVPKLQELNELTGKTIQRIFDLWLGPLVETLLKEVRNTIPNIVSALIKSINYYYVFVDLLNERTDLVRNKITSCIKSSTSKHYQMKAKDFDLDKLVQSLMEKARPEIAKILEAYSELKKQSEEVRLNLLPLLQKYINNPV
jgi:hypothetical protein